jgi:hypothetical protein
MSSDFGASSSFESESSIDDISEREVEGDWNNQRRTDWHMQRKIKTLKKEQWDEVSDLGDSCCFGTRTLEMGQHCVWKLPGGI